MEDELSLGEWLREARMERELPLRALARQLDIAPSYLSDIENDRRVPAEDILRKFTDELGLDFEEAMARAGRFGNVIEQYIRRQPEAVKLFRRVSAANLNAQQLRELGDCMPGVRKRKGNRPE